MVVINFQEQIQPGIFEYAVHYLFDNKLDLSLFDAVYKNDKTGRFAYDLAILSKNHFICLFKRHKIKQGNRLVLHEQYYFYGYLVRYHPALPPLQTSSDHILKQQKPYWNKCFWFVRKYLKKAHMNAYIPDNKFRSRDQKFADQKQKYPRPSPAVSNLLSPKILLLMLIKKLAFALMENPSTHMA